MPSLIDDHNDDDDDDDDAYLEDPEYAHHPYKTKHFPSSADHQGVLQHHHRHRHHHRHHHRRHNHVIITITKEIIIGHTIKKGRILTCK